MKQQSNERVFKSEDNFKSFLLSLNLVVGIFCFIVFKFLLFSRNINGDTRMKKFYQRYGKY